jgi:hypothetical protein
MRRRIIAPALAYAILLTPLGTSQIWGQDAGTQILVDHSDCTFLGAKRELFMKSALKKQGARTESPLALRTREVTAMLSVRPQLNIASFANAPKQDSIDFYILNALNANNITPAEKTDDYTFIRRVTLDLTGRLPLASRVTQFVADTSPNKRGALIDELMATPQWADKWTMYFGDLYQNNATNQQIQRRNEGRNAFYKWIHDSLAANKPYNQMAKELIAAEGDNSFDQTNGQINWLIGGRVTGGPNQDIFDQQAANLFEQLMGMTHVNCLLCHNGAGHLDSLSLWGSQTSRFQAEQLSAFMAKTWVQQVKITDPSQPTNNNLYYWALNKYTTDYGLNTTTGNRPSRLPLGTVKVVTPNYIFSGKAPAPGQDYRAALADFVTTDVQFARATVNYMWAYFFGMGIVDPPDQFDPARLDPDNPPPAPWTLQPSNPALLNALTQHFIASGYDLKALMHEITASETYQLSSEYKGQWNATYEPFFARKFVRRLWAEEVHDGVVQATGLIPGTNGVPAYNVNGFSAASTTYSVNSPGFGPVSYAMQLPDVLNLPDGGGAVSQFLDTFLRGDRDSNPRRQDGSILQTLDLMNDTLIEARVKAANFVTDPKKGTVAAGLLASNMGLSNLQLVDLLFMNTLSRHPTADETNAAIQRLTPPGARTQAAEDIFWALFNKVDFIFNY